MGDVVGPEWYVALSCGMRGMSVRKNDTEMSLLGIDAKEEFEREQLLGLVHFWRIGMPLILGLVVGVFFAANAFLIQTQNTLESATVFNLSQAQAGENQTLQVMAREFNQTVAYIQAVETSTFPKSKLIEKIVQLAGANKITIVELTYRTAEAPLTITGKAESLDGMSAFKAALVKDHSFKNVNLPLDGYTVVVDGVNFSLTFELEPISILPPAAI